ncbi:MspA family porin [Nocardia sp. BMG111209]|uniref:MspA family porin n=1 Tax=Nocardia sp. BMG111209 TaxID=1160137 RepID=UPI0003710579|nr:MspA family porin [Nocardia sp. BMG111209]
MRGALSTAFVAFASVPMLIAAGGAAHADTQVALPDGHIELNTRDGLTIDVDRTGEHATISGSLADNPLSRNAWVSGVTSVHVTAPDGVKVTGGRIETGYLLGCQIDLGSGAHAEGSGDAAGQATNQGNGGPNGQGGPGGDQGGQGGDGNGGGDDSSGGDSAGASSSGHGSGGGYGGGGGGLSVGAGDLGVGVDGNGLSPYGDPNVSLHLKPGSVTTKQVQTYTFTGTDGITQYVDHALSIDGCAGAAEARAYTTVTVHDNVMDGSQTLWGRPFSIG